MQWLMPLGSWFQAVLRFRCLWCWIPFPPSPSSSSHSPSLPNNCATYLGEDLLFSSLCFGFTATLSCSLGHSLNWISTLPLSLLPVLCSFSDLISPFRPLRLSEIRELSRELNQIPRGLHVRVYSRHVKRNMFRCILFIQQKKNYKACYVISNCKIKQNMVIWALYIWLIFWFRY